MNLKINEQSGETINFTLTNSSIAFANSLRRVLLSEIPSLAIDIVDLEKNYTMIPDEMIVHRLAMIPLKSSITLLNKTECSCTSHCEECAVEGSLDVYNKSPTTLYVTAKDINFKIPAVCASEAMIIKLGENQSIKCRVIAKKGIGLDHSKYCQVTAVNFEYDEKNSRREVESRGGDKYGVVEDTGMDYLKKPDVIKMEVEVVENTIEPIVCLRTGLGILKSKVNRLITGIEML